MMRFDPSFPIRRTRRLFAASLAAIGQCVLIAFLFCAAADTGAATRVAAQRLELLTIKLPVTQTGVRRANGFTTAAVDASSVYRNREHYVIAYVYVVAGTCTYAQMGTSSTPAPPRHGSLSYRVQSKEATGACAGNVYPYTFAYYTWTDASAAGTSDSFSLRFTSTDGTTVTDSSWALTLTNPDQDADATGSGDAICHAITASLRTGRASLVASARGCAVWTYTPMTVSLMLQDTPVGYRPPRGPAVEFGLVYAHRDAQQPDEFNYVNLGPKWTTTWLSYIVDSVPTTKTAKLYPRGGGAEVYTFATSAATASRAGAYSQAVLTRETTPSDTSLSFTRHLKDGSTEIFSRAFGFKFFLTDIIDPQGNRVTLAYDTQQRITSITDAVGQVTVLSYIGPDRKIVRVTDPFGRTARFTYNTDGQLASITDRIGLTSSFTYGPGNFINALTTPYGTTRFAFADSTTNPALGSTRILTATDPLGQTTRVEFNMGVTGLPATATSVPAGMATANADLNQRNTYIWDPVQLQQAALPGGALDYSKARVMHWLTSADGSIVARVVGSTRDPLEGRIWSDYAGQADADSEGTSNQPTHVGRVLDGGATQLQSYAYNAAGNLTQWTDPVGRQTAYSYDATGIDLLQIANTTAGVQVLSSATYNAQHLPVTVTDAARQTTRLAYNTAGQLIGATDALNNSTTFNYDNLGRLLSTVNANGATQSSLTYDAVNRVATSTDSEGYVLGYAYDNFDRVTAIRYPDGTTTQYGYDRLDRVSQRDRLGRVTTYGYDALRRLTATTDPLARKTAYGYYATGALNTLTDPKGNVTTWFVDLESRQSGKRYADGNAEFYAYEGSTARLRAVTDAMGQVKTYGYTPDDRTASITYASATQPTPSVAFVYDPVFARLTTMHDGIGTTTWAYHPVGGLGALKLALEDGPYTNDIIAYQYDALGRAATRTIDVAAETFAYDRLGRTIQHNSALGNFTRTYLGQTGQMTSQSNGVVGTSWLYDGNINDRRLLAIGNSGQARSFGFTTTPENRIAGIAETIGGALQRTWGYGYDASDRLVSAQQSNGATYSYGYDASDNLTNINGTGATYNAANQIASLGGVSYVYDANGNLVDDGIRTYQWDAEDRLVGLGYRAQPGLNSKFRYDGMGRRLSVADTTTSGIFEMRYLWCEDQLCQARAGGDAISRQYFKEGQTTPQVGMSLYYSKDQIGSVRDALASQSGVKLMTHDYDPYGAPTAASGRVLTDIQYAGLFFHSYSGMYLGAYRVYDPKTGRWLSRDGLKEESALNLYEYAGPNPISNFDTLGLESVSVNLRDRLEQGEAIRTVLDKDKLDADSECASSLYTNIDSRVTSGELDVNNQSKNFFKKVGCAYAAAARAFSSAIAICSPGGARILGVLYTPLPNLPNPKDQKLAPRPPLSGN